MIETLLIVAGVIGGSTVGWLAGKRNGIQLEGAEAAERVLAVTAQRDSAERKARELQNESARWKALSLAGQPFAGAPLYDERPSARDAEELGRLLRGLTLIDDVVLADANGLALTREENRASADLAAIAPHVTRTARRLALSALPTDQIAFETFAAQHVCARPLTGRAAGAILLVSTTSQRANPLAIDAVVHAAASTASDLSVVSAPSLAATGSNERLEVEDSHLANVVDVLEREVGRDFRAITLAADGVPLFSVAKDGPTAAMRRTVSVELHALQHRVTRTLRAPGMARMDVTLRGGDAITWASVGPRSRLSVVTRGAKSAPAPGSIA